jgi:hypothetical protein
MMPAKPDAEKKAKKDREKPPEKPAKITKGADPGVSADSLAQAGILFSRFGMQARNEKWQDEMLTLTKQIATNTQGQTAGPPGPIAN